MKRKFAVFDIDGTLIRWQLYHAIAEALSRFGHIDPVTHTKIREARMLWKKRTDENAFKHYESILVEAYDQLVKQLPVELFDKAAKKVFDEYKDQVYTYTRDLIRDLKQQNYLLFAISGSQKEIVAMIAEYYGFDDYVGSTYMHQNGYYTGKKIVASSSKHAILGRLIAQHDAAREGSIAVGDSGSDTTMLKTVDMPVAFNPDKSLYETALRNDWKIVVERKNVVYELEKGDKRYELLV
ncbi:HAD-IB family hydrolase [soil metagenome]